MTRTIDDILGEAARLPLWDAAYLIWREKTAFERLEGRRWRPRDERTPAVAARSMRRISAQLKHERDTAQDGPTFDRLKRAHPRADDTELKQAIVAAVRFDDACLRFFSSEGGDFWHNVVRAVARAAKEHPGYLATTYRDARNWIAFNMK
jgi:hypothetical protein